MGISEPWHDPELRFLEVLDREVRLKAERAADLRQQRLQPVLATQRLRGAQTRVALPAPNARAKRGEASRLALRMGRRSLTLMALLCLLGATAYGAGLVLSNAPRNPLVQGRGAFALVASGGAGDAAWKLRLYTRGGELCRALSVAETESSACAERPSAARVQASSAASPSHRYVFGVTGGKVLGVRVRAGDQTQTLATLAPSAGLRRRAGLPARVRFYVVVLRDMAASSNRAALVQALGVNGLSLGGPVPTCIETGQPGGC